MSDVRDFLLELGTEELPPKALSTLSDALLKGIEKGLAAAELSYSASKAYASPRRLALVITGLQTHQADRNVEKRGPAVTAGFDEDGNPTKALQGFARSCGVEVDALETLETDKGAWLVYREKQSGQAATELLPEIVKQALAALPIPKRMRWGSLSEEFVRPVHWLILMLGDEIIPANLLGVQSNQLSYGHRFHHPQAIRISSPQTYAPQLLSEGHVMVDFKERREAIRGQVSELATQLGGQAIIDDELLDEVTGLVEWPVALSGEFDKRFLELPSQALISSMQGHQKYFPVEDAAGMLLPYFITVCNIESRDPAQVIAGNERVILPRLSDAAFFWDTDRKRPLADRQEQLKTIVFQKQLGTVHDKSQRVAKLASFIAVNIGGDTALAARAAMLAKCDLVTEMVGEFPELQGIMGSFYARLDGEQEELAMAMDEQYLPRFAGDVLPQGKTGQALSLAEKIDTLCGLFGIGQPPSGAKDPFALRRAALGVLRIIIENDLDLDLAELLQQSVQSYDQQLTETDIVEPVMQYLFDRLRGYAADAGHHGDVFEAVLALQPTRPLDFMHRMRAVSAFREMEQAEALAAGNKRIDNILRKNAAYEADLQLNPDLLEETAEQQLAETLKRVSADVGPMMQNADYTGVLRRLADMRDSIDAFFDEVMVMAEDEAIRHNRLALLNQTRALFLGVADISRLQN
ncbi:MULTISPECIES: glycine--tRNA ligase subunit beta [unclassified Methylophaga]|jgi:glycyl-tRNA synthetase beta chain|uniref:glycine--tRNA ligase subunit beta n=3 Tax=Methylophaga TaxID=40222 RepID=UPI000C8BD34F|nr:MULTISPECIES: glycine--tRNA ligase subunit beta [unclassified Methylophaga]MAK66300.1 glycine--tRNA ligase subunit beta [Methylophaga sp.]MAY17495.1 glycine--tRNA ligase subunit beta [Methylophaga sp.]HAO25387.1 glycine--tRNA ligase subunit beta [Methylophaga sp.]HCD04223.1 glycine--tRNA ligase subunit beta [Methylophaga sp.]|tara:strand:- start:12450 stop:14528 length:2079 start_codon:yes stop_codon:yes gene_type:complete